MRSISQVITLLHDRATARLTDEDIDTLAGGSEFAAHMASDARDVLSSIGCLVRGDDSNVGGFTSDKGVPELCFLMSNVLDVVASLIAVSDNAKYERSLRREASQAMPPNQAVEEAGA